jgi:hypothetical protein
MSSFDRQSMITALRQRTTYCDDIINAIVDKYEANLHRHFKVGESYVISTGTTITITRLTRCFVRFDVLRGDRCIDNHQTAKIRLDSLGHQYITHKYINDRVVSVEP